MPDFNYSFSGIKSAFMYFIRDQKKLDENFVEKNLADICASYQWCLSEMLFKKLMAAAKEHNIKTLAIAGGVSANSLLRKRLAELKEKGYQIFIPPFEFCTDNAAMIGITGHFKYLKKEFTSLNIMPKAQYSL